MKAKKARTAVIAVSVATAIALSGTFAWQSISQMARNQAKEPTNPGGRLHDDFSGYEADDTKDIYVENFGNEPIYARVRLDEYMEIGEGAGLMGTVDTPNPDNHATPLVTGSKIDDVTTWTTHIPGDTAATTGVGKETGFTDPGKTFHTYWTWTMGGHATDNADGKTVYMPTFNKNKDSLKADINGTLEGLDGDPDTGEHYDDYHAYALSDPAETRVRDADTATYPDGAAYDADEDTIDECGPYGGAGGTGVAGTNYEMKEESHNPQETMHATVITMAEYKTKTDAQKAEFLGWVYDVDGWAYWSQPIAPGTPTEADDYITNATGLLLDRIELTSKPSEAWYYSINAVGQFITADDLGRSDDPQTGFYAEGEPPTEDALDLLDGIGVNTAAVKGSVTPAATVTVDSVVKHLDYAVQGMSIDLSATVLAAGVATPDQAVTWKVTGNSDTNTVIDTSSGSPVLKVGSAENGPLTLVATSDTYNRLKGKLTLVVQPLTYIVTVTAEGDATSVLPGKTLNLTAKLTRNDFQTVPDGDQTFSWNLDTTDADSDTILTPNASDSSKASLAVAQLEKVENLTLTVTSTVHSTAKQTITIPVTKVGYTVTIRDGSGNPVGATVTIKDGESATFTKEVISDPVGETPTENWTWTSSDTTGKITVNSSTGEVSVARDTATGTTATITVKNSDYSPALEASFTVNVQKVTYTVTVTPATATVYPGKTQTFTASVTADVGDDPADTVTWTVEDNTDSKTKFTDNVLTVGADETQEGTLTVKATHASGTYGEATVTVGKPSYTLKINDKDGSELTGNAKIKQSGTADFSLNITSSPVGYTPSGTWSWTSSDTAKATVAPKSDTTKATVTIPAGATVEQTATITVTNSDDADLKVTFTVEVADKWETMTVDGVEYIVLLKDVTVNGKAGSDTTAKDHKAALLLAKNTQGANTTFGSSNSWENSTIRSYLNGKTGSDWLAGKTETQAKAITVSLKTRRQYNDPTPVTTDDTVFLLSSADVCGKYVNSGWKDCEPWEYTYGSSQLTCFKADTGADPDRVAKDSSGTAQVWWLRSPSSDSGVVAHVTTDGNVNNYYYSLSYGVRPAFWYNLDP